MWYYNEFESRFKWSDRCERRSRAMFHARPFDRQVVQSNGFRRAGSWHEYPDTRTLPTWPKGEWQENVILFW